MNPTFYCKMSIIAHPSELLHQNTLYFSCRSKLLILDENTVEITQHFHTNVLIIFSLPSIFLQ